ncbi:major facilitator superfamily transporter [Grosmannia clavigera kw1407]|uniref:Major facilitator superfamily transporter n=1 Tax=Grosmannia clavigera (strain kw1407 / UAMH 11150) TaxID=655863 RepID=F0XIA8_GROCL|nr:major facilitator superfamily transporter [Grosmannia clavigera kw1407]EFX02636.1 major facilitator superfamily transporter [Grosmannia clavigera kw1407]
MDDKTVPSASVEAPAASVPAETADESWQPSSSRLMRFYSHPWTQIGLISFIFFCLPGMYNALGGLGGSGQVDSTVSANATVALLSATAATALFFVGPIFTFVGPRICFLVGGWTYALYSGSLLCFNHRANGSFVIAAGALLGIGASFVWIVQGAIMTTYVPEAQKGRAIAVFWIVFNLGGGIGSLASFGLNFHSKKGTVSDSTYIALMVIMLFGWLLGVFICDPKRVRLAQLHAASETERTSVLDTVRIAVQTIASWRVLCMLPLFFCANIFYSYQQNDVNGLTFNIRSRSLNGALYWMAQMVGGLVIGMLLDMPWFGRPVRARCGWVVLFVTGMAIWGGGYAFQKWDNVRLAAGHKQDLDYTDGKVATGPIFLYIFYGLYDALWQGFCYWLIGTESNSTGRAAVLVGAYKTFQSAGGAFAWRINALHRSGMTQLAIDWGLCMGSLVIVLPTVLTVKTHTSIEQEAGFLPSDTKDGQYVAEEAGDVEAK